MCKPHQGCKLLVSLEWPSGFPGVGLGAWADLLGGAAITCWEAQGDFAQVAWDMGSKGRGRWLLGSWPPPLTQILWSTQGCGVCLLSPSMNQMGLLFLQEREPRAFVLQGSHFEFPVPAVLSPSTLGSHTGHLLWSSNMTPILRELAVQRRDGTARDCADSCGPSHMREVSPGHSRHEGPGMQMVGSALHPQGEVVGRCNTG